MFYRFECHEGDDNDNSISEVIVKASSLENAFDCLARHRMPMEADVTWNEDSLYGLSWESTDDEEYDDEHGGIPRHCDYYYQEVYDTREEANDGIAWYHAHDKNELWEAE